MRYSVSTPYANVHVNSLEEALQVAGPLAADGTVVAIAKYPFLDPMPKSSAAAALAYLEVAHMQLGLDLPFPS